MTGFTASHCPKSRASATLIKQPNAVPRTMRFIAALPVFQPDYSKQCSCRESGIFGGRNISRRWQRLEVADAPRCCALLPGPRGTQDYINERFTTLG